VEGREASVVSSFVDAQTQSACSARCEQHVLRCRHASCPFPAQRGRTISQTLVGEAEADCQLLSLAASSAGRACSSGGWQPRSPGTPLRQERFAAFLTGVPHCSISPPTEHCPCAAVLHLAVSATRGSSCASHAPFLIPEPRAHIARCLSRATHWSASTSGAWRCPVSIGGMQPC